MGFRELRIQTHGFIVGIDGLLRLSEFGEHDAQVVIRVGIVRLQAQSFLIVGKRVGRSLHFFKESTEIVMCNVVI